jgi:hypothetical protein
LITLASTASGWAISHATLGVDYVGVAVVVVVVAYAMFTSKIVYTAV